MLVLPRPNPLYQNIPVNKVKLPEMLAKMGSGGFTGYLGYGSVNAEAYVLFAKGVMISILLLEGERQKTGFEALAGLYDQFLTENGHFNIYRMTSDLVVCTHAILHGTTVSKSQPVSSANLNLLLATMKANSLNGTVLFSTNTRNAMIFYNKGLPVGFYHDSAHDIETSPEESQRIAALPGACVEIKGTKPIETLMQQNLLEMLNIDRLWEAALKRNSGKRIAETPHNEQNDVGREKLLDQIKDDLKEIASAYLGRQGTTVVEKLLDAGGGQAILLDTAKRGKFLSDMAKEASSIDPEAKTEEMIDLMQSEIAGQLSV